ncbi:TetR family transcriptional regulator [Antricoccus suffuscus]|uniref:TetR family transcriptional regulator n=1 Tax=Antricoccus suffuscus TaxID=1629062 RepID=A0A2T0ZYU5_9ACTN|nr:TetR/AcrR family transcriptional regulator [Antricoccus suffuscus]PRZ41522.1 TetR family transcriptional regulator [Antricoccus suffuscus]
MSDSANERDGLRDARRRETRRRIVDAALRLTAEHGFDGFTIDELAVAAGISRRTFFNYFPAKEDALFGGPDTPSDRLQQRFVAGKPSGRLMDDLVTLFRDSTPTRNIDPAQIRLFRKVMETEHNLIPMFRKRFADGADKLIELICERESLDHPTPRAQMAVDILGSLIGRTFQQFAADDNTADFDDLLTENLRETSALLA